MNPRRRLSGGGRGDTVFKALLFLAASTIPALLIALVIELTRGARQAIDRFGAGFIFGSGWDPVAGTFGAWPAVFGTLLTSALALLLAVPLALGVAIYLTEFAPMRIRRPVATMIELLAAIPSVVYGLWGIFVMIPFLRTWVYPVLEARLGFLPFFAGPVYGPSVLSASLILTVMIIPFIMSVSREVLLAVPPGQREAALALGATRWEAVSTVIVPYAKSGILGAVILGLGRALGETMAVTMLIGNRHEIAASLFAPGYSMAAVIANEFADAAGGPLHESALIYLALILFGVTVIVNGAARLMIWRVARRGGAT
ncbi:MAG TPA: phosphate ABC transporter permease subunit PstC [Gemmatimonadaceae bacterium]|jgi:phosphate transport system permease protein|nr:phosphate ABC transporter permease subunit PstC [Gemmatimonadaceae bacterium]